MGCPVILFEIRGSAAKRLEFPQGITFANGLVILASGQKGKAASGSPAASLVVQLIYK